MRDRRTLLNKENKKIELQEECRFILWGNMMESEIRIGRTAMLSIKEPRNIK